jgi:hypothetical protein
VAERVVAVLMVAGTVMGSVVAVLQVVGTALALRVVVPLVAEDKVVVMVATWGAREAGAEKVAAPLQGTECTPGTQQSCCTSRATA